MPELLAYTLVWRFSHASHRSGCDSLSPIGADMARVETKNTGQGWDRRAAILGKGAHIVCSESSLWLLDLQSSPHCREQWTTVTPSLLRALNVYSKVC